jgi:hypothetical protein
MGCSSSPAKKDLAAKRARGNEMKEYRITLTDGVMHYMKGDSAKQVRAKFQRDHPTLPLVAAVNFLRFA